jgi:hypothetical protein
VTALSQNHEHRLPHRQPASVFERRLLRIELAAASEDGLRFPHRPCKIVSIEIVADSERVGEQQREVRF